MNATPKLLLVLGCMASVPILLFACFIAAIYYSSTWTVMTKPSPDSRHTAKLVRYQAIDVNFEVIVDGDKVFWSADFAPVNADLRESINWDKSGKIVVLEVGGQRIFGFDISQQLELSNSDLLKVEFTPFQELGYEGEIPRVTAPP